MRYLDTLCDYPLNCKYYKMVGEWISNPCYIIPTAIPPAMRAVEYDAAGTSGTLHGAQLHFILIDDHAILRDGLRALLDTERDFEVIAEAGTIADGIALSKQLQPDVVIADISFPEGDGLEAISTLRRECPGARIIVLTIHNTQECLNAAMAAGAHAFVAKDYTYDVLLSAIRSAISGRERTAKSLPAAQLRGALTVRRHDSPVLKLTLRERQVLVAVAQGYTSKQIAAKLERSVKTVVKHRSNMMRKLNLHDASAVTRFAIANGLLSL
jgi:DNA-binding NarL/FixJ family response regulator